MAHTKDSNPNAGWEERKATLSMDEQHKMGQCPSCGSSVERTRVARGYSADGKECWLMEAMGMKHLKWIPLLPEFNAQDSFAFVKRTMEARQTGYPFVIKLQRARADA